MQPPMLFTISVFLIEWRDLLAFLVSTKKKQFLVSPLVSIYQLTHLVFLKDVSS